MKARTIGIVAAAGLAALVGGCGNGVLSGVRSAAAEYGIGYVELYDNPSEDICRNIFPDYPNTYLFQGVDRNRSFVNQDGTGQIVIVAGIACCNEEQSCIVYSLSQ